MRIMQEVVRVQHRREIQVAVAISVGLGDRGGYNLVRFRCDSIDDPIPHRKGKLLGV